MIRTTRLLLGGLLLPGALQAQTPVRPLEVDDVIELTRLTSSAEAQADLVRSSCVAFPLDAGAVARLRAGGVGPALMGVVESACFAGSELVVTSEPSGGSVSIDGSAVGTTPWIGRFTRGTAVGVSVATGGSSLRLDVTLRERQRTQATFRFPEPVVAVPRVRTVGEIADALDLAGQWRPAVPRPSQPSNPAPYGGPVTWLVNLGGMAGGAVYCRDAANNCWIEPTLEDDGTDTMEPVRMLAGAGAGLLAGVVVNGLIGKVVNSTRRGSYRSAVERRAEWDRSNEVARANWVRSHPDVVDVQRREEEARRDAEAHNAAVLERNRMRDAVTVSTEPLPGPGGA